MLPVLLAVLSLAIGYECPLNTKFQSVLASNAYQLTPNHEINDNSYMYNITYDEALSQVPSVTLCIQSYEAQTAGRTQIDVNITTITKEDCSLAVQQPENYGWSKVTLNTLVSTRRDMELGTVSIHNPIFFKDNSFSFSYQAKSEPTPEHTQIKVFISSLDVSTQSGHDFMGIKPNSHEWADNYIIFTMTAIDGTVIQHLQISVVLFHKHSPGLLYATGNLQQNFLTSAIQITIPEQGINQLRSYMVGLIGFETGANTELSLSASLSDKFTIIMGPITEDQLIYMSVNYIVFAVVECGACTNFPYPYDDTCQESCPPNTIERYGRCIPKTCTTGFEIHDDGDCVPVCGDNAVYSNGYCVCEDVYHMINGKCDVCDDGTYWNYRLVGCVSICGEHATYNSDDGKCYCNDGYRVLKVGNNLRCGKCTLGTVYDKNTRTCVNTQTCGSNEVWSSDGCVCRSGYDRLNGKCSRCPDDSEYNHIFGTCICDVGEYDIDNNICISAMHCAANQVVHNGQCICRSGYNKIGGKCVKCPQNSYFDVDKGHCSCNPGYSFKSNGCYRQNSTVPNCSSNQHIYDGICICNSGYSRSGTVCILTCLTNQQPINNVCKCKSGYARNPDGQCYAITCPTNQQYSVEQRRCIPKCPQNQQYWNGSCICEVGYSREPNGYCYQVTCQQGEFYNNNSRKCQSICQPGYFYNIVSRRCESKGPCPGQYEYWNNYNYSCICMNGYERNLSGVCVVACVNNQERVNGVCRCQLGYRTYNGYCVAYPCPAGQIYDESVNACIVNCNNNQVWNGYQCTCAPGSELWGQNCVPMCGPNQVRQANGTCACKGGFARINNQCVYVPCPSDQIYSVNYGCIPICTDNSYYNGSTCVCEQGYQFNNYNQCVQACNQNEERVNGICVCKSGYHKVNNYCVLIICPVGQAFSHQLGICVQRCQVNQTWNANTNSCLCKVGFIRHNSMCVRGCPTNQQWNPSTNQCICPAGYQMYGGNCIIVCKVNQQWDAATNQCVCVSGFRMYAGNCVPNCTNNEVWNGSTCVCKTGYQRYLNTCVPACRANEVWNAASNGCVCVAGYERYGGNCLPVCGVNEVRGSGGVCVCKIGYTKNVSGVCVAIVVCGVGQIKVNNTCVDICNKPNQIYNNGQCVCKVGYQFDHLRNCVLPCSTNQIRISGVCSCKPNFIRNNLGNCVVNSSITCIGGAILNQLTGKCTCPFPQIWVMGRCQNVVNTCGANAYWTGTGCACNYGYYMNNGVCVKTSSEYNCPENSWFNGFSCTCDDGYYPLSALGCSECPQGTTWNGTSCASLGLPCAVGFSWNFEKEVCEPFNPDCQENEYWDGFNCRCILGCYWIHAKCTKCTQGTYFDGVQCVTNQLVTKSCTSPYQFYNSVSCVCINGFYLVKDYCVTCPQNYVWNGYFCQRVALYSLIDDEGELGAEEEQEVVAGSNTIPAVLKKDE